jgi:hypothetical protein
LEPRAIALVALPIKQAIVHTVVGGLFAKCVVLNLVLIWRKSTGDEVAPEPGAPGTALLCFGVLFASLTIGGGVGDLHYSIRVMGHDLQEVFVGRKSLEIVNGFGAGKGRCHDSGR